MCPKVKKPFRPPVLLVFLPKRWEKCIEIPKKLMARVCTLLPHLGPHLHYGYQGKNAIFWLRSFLTPLIAWKTPTNIRQQLCISQCPTRGPKSTKIELTDPILALWSDLEGVTFCLKYHIFDFFLIVFNPKNPGTFKNQLAHQIISMGVQGVTYSAWRKIFRVWKCPHPTIEIVWKMDFSTFFSICSNYLHPMDPETCRS